MIFLVLVFEDKENKSIGFEKVSIYLFNMDNTYY